MKSKSDSELETVGMSLRMPIKISNDLERLAKINRRSKKNQALTILEYHLRSIPEETAYTIGCTKDTKDTQTHSTGTEKD